MHLEHEVARCKRENSNVVVMVCDMNGFKQINDRYGHLVGDKALKIFANLLREICREYDYVARMGGDEFVIVAPNMTPAAIAERAALVSALAQQAGVEVCGKDILSSSVGASCYPQDGSDAEQLLAEADRKMYAAKQLHYEGSVSPLPLGPHAQADRVNECIATTEKLCAS
jgi:diguanylate cyclase (GGDEF)-like protein